MRYLTMLAAVALSICGTPAHAQSVTINPPPTWRACATEGGICASRAGALVRYGAGDRFTAQVVNGKVRCDNPTFGDPAEGTVKACAIASPAAITKPVVAPTPAPAPSPTPAPTDPRARLGINVAGLTYWSSEATTRWSVECSSLALSSIVAEGSDWPA